MWHVLSRYPWLEVILSDKEKMEEYVLLKDIDKKYIFSQTCLACFRVGNNNFPLERK